MNNTQCKFLGFAYFLTPNGLKDISENGIIHYCDETDRWLLVTRRIPWGVCIAPKFFKLENGVKLSDIEGKVCSRAHKVFTKDWPFDITPLKWTCGAKNKYRVAIYNFNDNKMLMHFPVRVLEDALLKTHYHVREEFEQTTIRKGE